MRRIKMVVATAMIIVCAGIAWATGACCNPCNYTGSMSGTVTTVGTPQPTDPVSRHGTTLRYRLHNIFVSGILFCITK